jgi:hypothetical protein
MERKEKMATLERGVNLGKMEIMDMIALKLLN